MTTHTVGLMIYVQMQWPF